MAVNFFPEDSGSSGSGGGGTGNYIPLTQKGSANGVATLDASAKVPSSQLPDISITNTFVVATEVEMLALNAQTGDIAVRTDVNKTFILKTSPASVIGNWVELPTPTNGVFSVDGKTGAVTLTNTYQAKSNELTALSALTDTPGFIKKVGDGVYAVDTTAYLSVADASTFYQPLNTNLTSISGITGPYGFLVKTVNGWALNTSGYQHASPLLTGIANLAGDGYLEKVGTGWVLNPGPFQPLDINLTGISAIAADGFLIRTGGVWAMDSNRYQHANNELSGFSALPDEVGLVKKTGDGTYVLDKNTYLTTASATANYQPLNTNLTGISGLVGTAGTPKMTAGVWSLDATTYLTGNQTITLSGDISGSGTTAITATLANVATAGTYPKVTINAKGLVTSGASLVATDIPNLDWAKITTGKPTTIAGYGITDAFTKTEVNQAMVLYGYSKQEMDTGLSFKQNINNELTGFMALADTAGFVKKTGDGTYAIDTNTYITSASLASNYQPLNANLTGISGITGTSGFIKQTNGVWSLDSSNYITGNQTITLSGDATGSGTTSIAVAIPSLAWSKISSKPTTILGYGIVDAYTKTEVDTSLAGKQNINNELTALSSLADTTGFIRKTGDGSYSIDTNTYLTVSSASSTYQPLNTNLTAISGLNGLDGFVKRTNGSWSLDTTIYLTTAGTGLTSTGNTINVIGTTGRIVANADSIDLATIGTPGTYTKITTDAYGRAVTGSTLSATDIPNLDASKVTSGVIADDRLVGTYSQIHTLIRNTNNSSLFLKGGDATSGSGAFIHLYGKDSALSGRMLIDASSVTFRDETGNYNLVSATGTSMTIHYNTSSTSTTTGALVVNGGVGCQRVWAGAIDSDGMIQTSSGFQVKNPATAWDAYAGIIGLGVNNAINIVGASASNGLDRVINLFGQINVVGHLQLPSYPANAITPNANNIGFIWLESSTGNLKYVANSTTIKTITAV